jgi:hypothetical protein
MSFHDHEKPLRKSELVYHVREPHDIRGYGRVQYIEGSPQELRKWSVDDLRRAHDDLHEPQRRFAEKQS